MLCCVVYYVYVSSPQACSDKLKQEMKDFGYPPKFPVIQQTEPAPTETGSVDPTRRAKKGKSKVLAKTGNIKYQWQIMRSLGMDDEQIKR